MAAPELQYECVVCTRNRAQELRLSIPRLLAQTRPPRRVIVVDASDEPELARAAVEEVSIGASCEVTFIHGVRGSSVQRNEGLRLVAAEIVFFPDDDAWCDPDYAERILAIYERDTECSIGAVLGTHRSVPRDSEAAAVTRELSVGSRLRQRITAPRARLERRLIVDPLAAIAWERKAAWDVPRWLAEVDAQPNCWVRGFRMTFRTDAIRSVGGFDETLRNYATFEDIHAGLAVSDERIIVQAMLARVFHHQAPGGRGPGRVRGATNIANRAYVVACHSAPRSAHRKQVVKYGAYRCLLYALGSVWSSYHRDSFRGAAAVMRRMRPLLIAPPDRAGQAYENLLRRVGIVYE